MAVKATCSVKYGVSTGIIVLKTNLIGILIDSMLNINILRPRQMDAISQATFSNVFSWMKMFEFRLKFHWSLFPRVQLTIFHYLNQWWLVYWRIYASLGLNKLNDKFCWFIFGYELLLDVHGVFNKNTCSWWRHDMDTLSTALALCEANRWSPMVPLIKNQ